MGEIDEDDEVCGVFHASHRATSNTILAYLMAHRPNCTLAFKISFPSDAVQKLCEPIWDSSGLALRKECNGCLIGTADPVAWARLLLKQGEFLEGQSVSLSPIKLSK
jgi:hypothetical protein